MSTERVKAIVVEELRRIAPEVDPAALAPGAKLRDALEIDSYDFLRFLTAVCERLAIEIPESDYPRLATLEGTLVYLAERVAAPLRIG